MYTFRIATIDDAQSILDIYGYYILKTTFSFETKLPTLQEFESRISKVLREAPWLLCCFNNQIVGYAYASSHRSRFAYRYNKELSVYVSKDFQGKKIGSILYKTIIKILKVQGFKNVLAGITQPNPASVAFHKQIGFKQDRKSVV